MSRSRIDRNSLVRAAIASLVLHLLAVPLFTTADVSHDPLFAHADGRSDEATHVSTITFDRARGVAARRERTSFERPRPHPATSPVVASARVVPTTKPDRRPLTTERREHSTERARPRQTTGSALAAGDRAVARVASPRRAAIALTLQTAAPERDAATPMLAITPAARESETPAPERVQSKPAAMPPPIATPETPLAAVAARDGDIPPGGWGQSFAKPLVADEATLAELRAKYRGLRAIAIDVDASGHATHVAIPESVTGDARVELARVLSNARYVPAECNGLRCTGTMLLVL